VRLLNGRISRKIAVMALCAIAGLQGCKAEQPWPLWQKYTDAFMDANGRILDRAEGDRTTSEGQAYAMFFALVVNDRSRFDKLLHWTEDNLAGGDMTARLPAWNWGKASDGSWRILDANSASDADLWLAYDLLEAGRIWKVERYEKLGQVMAGRIAQSEVASVSGIGTVLLPGPVGFHPDPATYVLNPSYMPPQVVARLQLAVPAGPWGAIADSFPQLLGKGSGGGFAMDWVLAGTTVRPSPTLQQLAEGKKDEAAVGSYDAIRVYLWLGMADHATRGVQAAMPEVGSMGLYLKSHVTPPLTVDGTGKTLDEAGTIGFSAAVIPYLLTSGRQAEAKMQMDRLGASLDPITSLYGRPPMYYDQNLALFATGWMEKRFRFEKDGRLRLPWK
jgi:endoglucanase